MAVVDSRKGVIGILTGGGDVPGLNPAIRAVTIRALREGYDVIGIRRGWLAGGASVRPAVSRSSIRARSRSKAAQDGQASTCRRSSSGNGVPSSRQSEMAR